MRYESEGRGPALVLLPALGCDGRMWQPVAARLVHAFRVIRPETGGCSSLAAAAADVSELLASLGVTKAGVAGLSMGGYVALELLRAWPQGVRAAALLDTTAFADPPERQQKRQQTLHLVREGRFDEALDAYAASALSASPAADGAARDLLFAMARGLGAEAFAADVEAILRREPYADVLAAVRVPLLFMAGEHDALTPPEVARRMAAEVPGSRVEIVPGAGHLAALENPERVASALASFFLGPLGAG